jgi:alkylhydroperoxidase/carboxymuconolactone decarboxylase family protein YurZ
MKEELPKHFKRFVEKYPAIWEAHQKMTEACANAGPLDRKTRELIKTAIAATANLETAAERHAIMAVQEGATEEEVHQSILQMTTIVGFPRASAALKWIERGLHPRK